MSQSSRNIDQILSAEEHALQIAPDDRHEKPARMNDLAQKYTARFEETKDVTDIDKAIKVHEAAVNMIAEDHEAKPALLNDLGQAFAARFEETKDVADIDKAIEVREAAVNMIAEDNEAKPALLNDLGHVFAARFEETKNVADIDKAIEVREAAVNMIAEDNEAKPALLNDLGHVFATRFEETKDVADIDKAIEVREAAVNMIAEDHEAKPALLNDLGQTYTALFQETKDVAVIDKAIEVHETAVNMTSGDLEVKPARLNDLGQALAARFEETKNVADIEKAIEVHEAAVDVTSGDHGRKPTRLSDYSASLQTGFEHTGNEDFVHRAVAAQEEAVQLVPDDDPSKLGYLATFGDVVLNRFENLGDVADVTRSIGTYEDAVSLADDHSSKLNRLNDLGTAYFRRFERVADPADLNESITTFKNATELLQDDNPTKAVSFNHLGESYLSRFQLLGEQTDVDQSIEAFQHAVRITRVVSDAHAAMQTYLLNLGGAALLRFRRFAEGSDVDMSINAFEESVALTPDGHPSRPVRLTNLGGSYLDRFQLSKKEDDINKAIATLKEATQLAPVGHPDRMTALISVAGAYVTRFQTLKHTDDLNEAISTFAEAAKSTGPPSIRFNAALQWASCCLQSGASTLDAYSSALELFPRIAWLGQTRLKGPAEIISFSSIVRDAATAAIEAGEYEKALEWLEQGASVVLRLVFGLPSPVDDLRQKDPGTADRIEQLSLNLERSGAQDDLVDPDRQLTLEDVSQKRHRFADRWDNLIEVARAIPGFEDFLKPTPFSQLKRAARSGPVVVINTHSTRCDALVLEANHDSVIHVPLGNISADVAQLQISLAKILSPEGQNDSDNKFKEILSQLWSNVVHPVLRHLNLPISRDGDPPRIWWCTAGPLSLLPIHAAGLYDTEEQGTKITDFVASSYTPTLTALLSMPHTSSSRPVQLLAINHSSTPGKYPPPSGGEELVVLKRHTDNLRVSTLEGVQATVERVVEGIKKSEWIHLACSITHDIEDPTKSVLLLQDGQLELTDIPKIPLSDHADFAFLSAFQTDADKDMANPEGVNLATAFSLAGYHGVIATIWSVNNSKAPFVVDKVYARLKSQQSDSTVAAHSLHHAVQELRRQQGVSFISWIPFIHVGL